YRLDGAALVIGSSPVTYTGLADGVHTFVVRATDRAGNVGTASYTWTVDTVPPSPPFVSSTWSGSSSTSTPTVTGTAEPGSTVTVSGGGTALGTTPADSNSAWSFTTPPLADGTHDLTFTATDAAGNTSPPAGPRVFTVDTQAPAAPGGPVLSTGGSSSS